MSFPPGHPATYANVKINSSPSVKPYIPPEALESNENRKYRESKTRMFRYLNDPRNSTYRNTLRKKTGKEWKNIREQTLKTFQNELAAKEAKRAEALQKHKNKEWNAYIEEWKRKHPPSTPGSGLPTQGPPVRIFGGLRKTRKRMYKKKHGLVQNGKRRKSMRSSRRS